MCPILLKISLISSLFYSFALLANQSSETRYGDLNCFFVEDFNNFNVKKTSEEDKDKSSEGGVLFKTMIYPSERCENAIRVEMWENKKVFLKEVFCLSLKEGLSLWEPISSYQKPQQVEEKAVSPDQGLCFLARKLDKPNVEESSGNDSCQGEKIEVLFMGLNREDPAHIGASLLSRFLFSTPSKITYCPR